VRSRRVEQPFRLPYAGFSSRLFSRHGSACPEESGDTAGPFRPRPLHEDPIRMRLLQAKLFRRKLTFGVQRSMLSASDSTQRREWP